ncbi:MAG: GvpL/GvpF family gas vesicle protein [Chloroflexi bacterium]|nr:GvpL/GvpF family gas vesicle protein [Chloroflexota bacterium]
MTALYLYAITDRPEAPMPAEPGLESVSLLNISHQDIAAVVSPLSTTEVLPAEDNLWRHEAVVEALMVGRAVLPVRFGTVLASEAAAQAVLVTHYADFTASLDRVRGRVELGLRVLWDDDRPPTTNSAQRSSSSSGRSYLLARLEEERQVRVWRQQAEALAAELHTPLAQLAAESIQQTLITPRLLLTAAYLVERDRVTAFQREVGGLNAAYPALRLLCTGPWPPYSFVTATVPTADGEERPYART